MQYSRGQKARIIATHETVKISFLRFLLGLKAYRAHSASKIADKIATMNGAKLPLPNGIKSK